jgi:hypothetical protein
MLGYVGSVGAAWLIRKIFVLRSGVVEAEQVWILGGRMEPSGALVRLPPRCDAAVFLLFDQPRRVVWFCAASLIAHSMTFSSVHRTFQILLFGRYLSLGDYRVMPGGIGGVVGRWLQVHTSILHQHAGNKEGVVRVVSSDSVVESGQVVSVVPQPSSSVEIRLINGSGLGTGSVGLCRRTGGVGILREI